MSVRRFGVLLRGLPTEARFRFPEQGGWSRADHRQADTVELLHTILRQLIASAGGKPPKPVRLARPTDPKPKVVTPRDLIRRFFRKG